MPGRPAKGKGGARGHRRQQGPHFGQAAVGDMFAWFTGLLSGDGGSSGELHAELESEAGLLGPGESGLVALDWWNGNRSVLVDAELTGLLLGANLATGPAEIYRSLLEASVYGTRVIIETLESSGVPIAELVVCGGLPFQNRLLMQLSADRLLLLKRFTQVLDIDADRLTIPSEEANQSLGAVEIALLQRVNAATTDLDMDAYRRWVKRYFAQTLLAKRPGQLRVVLPESLRSWVEDETRRIRDTVERLGCSVVGSLDDLDPTAIGAGEDPRLTSEPESVSTDDVLDASVEVIAELLEEVRARQSPMIPAAARALAQQAPGTGDGPAARVKALARRLRRKD